MITKHISEDFFFRLVSSLDVYLLFWKVPKNWPKLEFWKSGKKIDQIFRMSKKSLEIGQWPKIGKNSECLKSWQKFEGKIQNISIVQKKYECLFLPKIGEKLAKNSECLKSAKN